MDADTDTRIVFIFTYVAFLGGSHMTNCSETRDTKTAMKEPVRRRITLIVLKFVECLGSAEVI
jgi:hypothetical protein